MKRFAKGNHVEFIRGEHDGKTGLVRRVLPRSNQIIVDLTHGGEVYCNPGDITFVKKK